MTRTKIGGLALVLALLALGGGAFALASAGEDSMVHRQGWEQVGLQGQFIKRLAPDPRGPSRLYAFGVVRHPLLCTLINQSYATLFRSDDAGATWYAPGRSCLGEATLSSLGVDADGTIYVVELLGTHISSDGGEGWRSVPQAWVEEAHVDSSSTGQLFGIGTRGFIQSKNGGETWEIRSSKVECTTPNVGHHAANPDRIFLGCVDGVRRSTDRGANWERTLPYGAARVAIDPRNPDIVYAGLCQGARKGLWSSQDAGETWTQVNDSLCIAQLAFDLRDPRRTGVVVGEWGTPTSRPDFGSHWSGDGGHTWIPLAVPYRQERRDWVDTIQDMIVVDEHVFIATNGNGIWRRHLPPPE